MYKQLIYFKIIIFLAFIAGCSQSKNLISQQEKPARDPFEFNQIKTDSLFNSNQIVSLLELQKSLLDKIIIDIAYSITDLITTSSFGEINNAMADINGGFFDMQNGGSVTYFEINDTVISRTRPNELFNGALIITNDHEILIQPAKSEQFYELSKKETAVLVTGPLLLFNSEEFELPDNKFANSRHPRTCLCITRESLLFITIDGRSEEADGMNLIEAQKFLLGKGCIDAINLDGGGSTTMWIKNKGVVNFPSDKTGERPVSNVLMISKKK
jgi:exopolysaccharide biosynthesis protein